MAQMRDYRDDARRVPVQRLVSELLEDRRITAWEREFLVSINRQLVSNDLSDKQLEIFGKIKKKYRNAI